MKLKAETNSEATNFIRSWKRTQKIFCFHIPDCHLLRNPLNQVSSNAIQNVFWHNSPRRGSWLPAKSF